MRNAMLALACAGGLTLGAGAEAESYSLLAGSVTEGSTGETTALSGFFEASLFVPGGDSEPPPEPQPDVLRVDDFALQAGDRSFTPALPVELDGLEPRLYLRIADQIHVDGDEVGLVRLRSGGEVVGSTEDEVTFRFTEFRGATSGRAAGDLGSSDGGLPRLLHIEGTLHEVDQTFEIRRDDSCLLFPLPAPRPPPGGGGIVIGGGGGIEAVDGGAIEIVDPGGLTVTVGGGERQLHVPESLIVAEPWAEIAADETTVQFVGLTDVRALNRVTGDAPSAIDGELHANGEVFILNLAGIDFGILTTQDVSVVIATVGAVPRLEELGITAPDGAEVTFDADGALSVRTDGDLFVDGGDFPEIPGLTSLTLEAGGDIVVTGTLALPPDVAVFINAGGTVAIPGDLEPPVVGVPVCPDLRPAFPPVERGLGTWSLLATAAIPVEVDVQPWRRRNLVRPDSRRRIAVALLGSDQLDVREVDPQSLRLGFGEAESQSRRGRLRSVRVDVNRDRRADLLALFDVRDAGIPYGDTKLCLVAQTYGGELLEGCDAIDTLSGWAQRRRPGWAGRIGAALRRPPG